MQNNWLLGDETTTLEVPAPVRSSGLPERYPDVYPAPYDLPIVRYDQSMPRPQAGRKRLLSAPAMQSQARTSAGDDSGLKLGGLNLSPLLLLGLGGLALMAWSNKK